MNMPLSVLNRRRRIGAASTPAFSPSTLFALAEPGVWYDPSDLTTLFTDTAGTTPVTTPGQTVALMLDKSKGLTLGTELVVNGDFATDTWWTKGAGCSISGGVGVASAAVSGSGLYRTGLLTSGNYYEITFTVASVSAGGFRVGFFNSTYSATRTAPGTYTVRLRADGTGFVVETVGTTTGTVDNVSVKEVTGFHATQATAASRPTFGVVPLGGRRNLLTWSEDFRTTAQAGETRPWTSVNVTATADQATAPDGTNTADLLTATGTNSYTGNIVTGLSASTTYTLSVYVKSASGPTTTNLTFYTNNFGTLIGSQTFTTTGDWQRITLTATTGTLTGNTQLAIGTANSFSTGESFYIWGAQLETGSTATAYQRTTTQFDVTEAGVQSLSYLSFDGVDDGMVTGTITPGVDKAQIFAGVRKLSDAAVGIVTELGSNSYTVTGSLGLLASGGSSLAGPYYTLHGNGSSGYSADFQTFAAPISNVVTAQFDTAQSTGASEATLRANGAAATRGATAGTTMGTGNFLALPLYIGRRAGTSVPLNGQIYSLITRFGANLTTPQITDTETWVNTRTGAF